MLVRCPLLAGISQRHKATIGGNLVVSRGAGLDYRASVGALSVPNHF